MSPALPHSARAVLLAGALLLPSAGCSKPAPPPAPASSAKKPAAQTPGRGIRIGAPGRFVLGINYPWLNYGHDFGVTSAWSEDIRVDLDKPCIVGELPTKNNKRPVRQYLDIVLEQGYAGALLWSLRASDESSDMEGASPEFSAWIKDNASRLAEPEPADKPK